MSSESAAVVEKNGSGVFIIQQKLQPCYNKTIIILYVTNSLQHTHTLLLWSVSVSYVSVYWC